MKMVSLFEFLMKNFIVIVDKVTLATDFRADNAVLRTSLDSSRNDEPIDLSNS